MRFLNLILIIGLLLNVSCKNTETQNTQIVIRTDSFSGAIIADTIIYDVIIKNANPDDSWTNECLKHFQHSAFIDSLFNLAYNRQVVVYDFFTKKPLKVKDLKRLEKQDGFKRANIGKIQFTEKWYFNSSSQQFQKEVISIVLGYELLSDEGIVRGYKPVFKIPLNH